jgi:hypothetical protein
MLHVLAVLAAAARLPEVKLADASSRLRSEQPSHQREPGRRGNRTLHRLRDGNLAERHHERHAKRSGWRDDNGERRANHNRAAPALGNQTATLADNATKARRRPPAVFVHWGGFTPLLRGSITITLRWGTDVYLCADFQVPLNAFASDRSGATFRRRGHNKTGSEAFNRAFDALHRANKDLFKTYPTLVERRNEVRYVLLYNLMQEERLDEVVHLDSDAALLAPPDVVFPSRLYAGCDAVITFGQISARWKPSDEVGLQAYWAGTAVISRPLLRDYLRFVLELYTGTEGKAILLDKQKAMPTVNDMTSWCLFTMAVGSDNNSPPKLVLDRLNSSAALAAYSGRHRICNTQPHSWSGEHGIVDSASWEIALTAEHDQMVTRVGERFYIDAARYKGFYSRTWNAHVPWLPPALATLDETKRPGPQHRLLTVHMKIQSDAAAQAYLSPSPGNTSSFGETPMSFQDYLQTKVKGKLRAGGGAGGGARVHRSVRLNGPPRKAAAGSRPRPGRGGPRMVNIADRVAEATKRALKIDTHTRIENIQG